MVGELRAAYNKKQLSNRPPFSSMRPSQSSS
jgi:hypothetical protein